MKTTKIIICELCGFINDEEMIDDEYNSDNTERLDNEGLKKLLLTLDYVKEELASYNN